MGLKWISKLRKVASKTRNIISGNKAEYAFKETSKVVSNNVDTLKNVFAKSKFIEKNGELFYGYKHLSEFDEALRAGNFKKSFGTAVPELITKDTKKILEKETINAKKYLPDSEIADAITYKEKIREKTIGDAKINTVDELTETMNLPENTNRFKKFIAEIKLKKIIKATGYTIAASAIVGGTAWLINKAVEQSKYESGLWAYHKKDGKLHRYKIISCSCKKPDLNPNDKLTEAEIKEWKSYLGDYIIREPEIKEQCKKFSSTPCIHSGFQIFNLPKNIYEAFENLDDEVTLKCLDYDAFDVMADWIHKTINDIIDSSTNICSGIFSSIFTIGGFILGIIFVLFIIKYFFFSNNNNNNNNSGANYNYKEFNNKYYN